MEYYEKEGKCCICGGEYTQWGNNALPLKDGRCCDICNNTIVVPERLKRISQGKPIY